MSPCLSLLVNDTPRLSEDARRARAAGIGDSSGSGAGVSEANRGAPLAVDANFTYVPGPGVSVRGFTSRFTLPKVWRDRHGTLLEGDSALQGNTYTNRH